MADQNDIGGVPVMDRLAEGLRPLGDIVLALNVANNRLSLIHGQLRNGVGVQANTGGAFRTTPAQNTAQPAPYQPGPATPPGATGSPTPVPRGPAGGSTGTGGSGGGAGAGGAGPAGPASGAAQPPSGFAGAQGNTLVDKAYNSVIGKIPLLSIPGSIRNEYQSQINKNNFYKGITGAETQGEAFGMRISEEMDRARYMRLFDQEENETLTKGLATMGLNSRNESVMTDRIGYRESKDFAYHAKEKYGATVEESLAVLQVASQQASIDLDSLNNNLNALSKAAGDAGVSASEARKQFLAAWDVNTRVGGLSGQEGANWAMAATAANTMAGPMFANDSAASRVATDTGYRAMLAASNGMTPGEMANTMRNDPAAAANMQTQSFIEYMRRYLGQIEPDLWAWLEAECQNQARDPGLIAQDFLDQWSSPTDPATLVEYGNAFQGSTEQFVSPNDVIAYLAKEMMGSTTGAILGQQQANAGATDMSGKSKADPSVKALDYGIEDLNKKESSGGVKVGGIDLSFGPFGKVKDVLGLEEDDDAGKATDIYTKSATASGERTAVIDRMLKKMTGKEEDDQKVEVETADGKVVMTLAEAMEGGFEDQISTGRARFVGGKYSGKTIAKFNDGQVNTDEAARTGSRESSSKTTDKGQDAESYYKAHPEDQIKNAKKTEKGGKYTIELSNDAKKFFQLSKDGDPTEPKENNNGFGGNLLNSMTFGVSGNVSSAAHWLGFGD